jgi:hypothetical protein
VSGSGLEDWLVAKLQFSGNNSVNTIAGKMFSMYPYGRQDPSAFAITSNGTLVVVGDLNKGSVGKIDYLNITVTAKYQSMVLEIDLTYYCGKYTHYQQDNVCGGHGQCIGDNNCLCDKGFNRSQNGTSCVGPTCFSISSNNQKDVCSGNGYCVRDNECICSDGYAGYNCQRRCDYCHLNFNQ